MTKAAYRPTELIINLSTLQNNLRLLKKRLDGKAKLMAVVKADAYGHGIVQVARLAIENGADMLGVAITEEGVYLREQGITAPILVFGGVSHAGARAAVQYGLSQTLYDLNTLTVLQEEALIRGVSASAHLKIDTGMTRIGIRTERALDDMIVALKCSPNIKLDGVYTHFADALDDPEFTRAQNTALIKAANRLKAEGFNPIVHAAASTAMLGDETLWHDMVRPGVALYGAEVRWLCPDLNTAQKLVTRPTRIEPVEAGASVGYGRAYRTERDSVIMTLPIGYGDGYPRALSNKAFVLVKGRRAPVVGRICMDMTTVDITDIPGVSLDDEVVLLGSQGHEWITPDELAAIAGTIPYEIMLAFGARIRKRAVR